MADRFSVALIGAGAMGGALLRGWLQSGVVDARKSAVFEPAADADLKNLAARHAFALNPALPFAACDALVVAVKPQAAGEALPAFAPLARDALVVSVMAGTSVARLSAVLHSPMRIARAMPNLPASVGSGITGLYAPPAVDAASRSIASRLMAAVGKVVWVDSETALDAVTAVSGSGPAYFFLVTEALAEAGVSRGLDQATAELLARATAVGAGAVLDEDGRTPAQLRGAVTSPGGTTAAALDILDGPNGAIRDLLKRAVAAAAQRAAELTK
jgi:pyrroline-5-carboxylate reductase